MDPLTRGMNQMQIATTSAQPILPMKRPGYCTTGEEVGLVVNYFPILTDIFKNKKISTYKVYVEQLSKERRGRAVHDVWKECTNKEYVRFAFWETWRCVRRDCGYADRLCIVFDDLNTAYLLNDGPEGEQQIRGHDVIYEDTKPVTLQCSLTLVNKFVCDPSTPLWRTDGNVDLSRQFMKLLTTQAARYSPRRGRNQDLEFHEEVNKWCSTLSSMFFIPRLPDDPEVKVTAGVRAWLGMYSTLKTMENKDVVLNAGLVHRLFYKLKMNLLEFYVELNGAALPVGPEGENLTMSEAQAELVTNRLTGVRVSTMYAPTLIRYAPAWQRELMTQTMVSIAWQVNALCLMIARDLSSKRNARRDSPSMALAERHYRFERLDTTTTARRKVLGRERVPMEHFYDRSGFRLRYPNLPLVEVKQGSKTEYVPFEVLAIHEKPQRYLKMLSFHDRRKYTEGVCMEPDKHHEMTHNLRNMILPDVNPFLEHCGVAVSDEMMRVTSSVLKPPTIFNKKGDAVTMKPDRSYALKELIEVATKIVFAAIALCDHKGKPYVSKDKIINFYAGLLAACRARGMIVEDDPLTFYEKVYAGEPSSLLRSEATVDAKYVKDVIRNTKILFDKKFKENGWEAGTTLVLLVFNLRSSFADDQYGRVKNICNTVHGIANQVIDKTTVEKGITTQSVFRHISLKINAKTGGVNQSVKYTDVSDASSATISGKYSFLDEDVMYVGVDVTHPSPLSGIDISIAAMVANVDSDAFQYKDRPFAQNAPRENTEQQGGSAPGRERLTVFKHQFLELLHEYRECRGKYPRHVVIYRDGVSDSEMLLTASEELNAIKEQITEPLKRLGGDGKRQDIPTFTYIIVQKRHQTRFYRPLPAGGEKKFGNMQSGTVVDRTIVSPHVFDFFLASHNGALGTSRCAHYTVWYDEWKLTADQIYEMTYRLSFLSARCRQPVSLPIPVYYAHIACEKYKEIYKAIQRDAQRLPDYSMQRQSFVEQQLTVHKDYPGMAFV